MLHAPTGDRLRLLPFGPDLVRGPASRGTRAINAVVDRGQPTWGARAAAPTPRAARTMVRLGATLRRRSVRPVRPLRRDRARRPRYRCAGVECAASGAGWAVAVCEEPDRPTVENSVALTNNAIVAARMR